MSEFRTEKTSATEYSVEWDADADVVEVVARSRRRDDRERGDSRGRQAQVGIIVQEWIDGGCVRDRNAQGVSFDTDAYGSTPGTVEKILRKALTLAFYEGERHV